jgi:hypothetical protein
MRNEKGQFVKGHRVSKSTEFKKGQHWRSKKPYWDKAWLEREYIELQKSAQKIATEWGVTENAILYWISKHDIPTRSMQEIRGIKHWGVSGSDNPMWNMRGELNPNWKGGVTPERQAFYMSDEWKVACLAVWQRDNAECQRCRLGRRTHPDMPMHIHHIVSFADKELRADVDNLVLLCETCHHFVHSKENTNNEYLR